MFSRPSHPPSLGSARPAALLASVLATLALNVAACGADPDGSERTAAANPGTVATESTAHALAADGAACTVAGDCTSNFCVDGVCCNTACGGSTTDCQACSIAAGGAADGICGARTVGLSCTSLDACVLTATCAAGGICSPATTKTCTASDQCHDVGVCDPTSGLCNNPVKLNGSACSDGNACTTGDVCLAGLCTPAATTTCVTPDDCHEATTCDTTTGACVFPVKADGTVCSDGNACTGTDTCHAGVCTGASPVVCPPPDQCHLAGTCNPATGTCSNPAKPDGTACVDGSMCTTADVCNSGLCGGTTLNCNDGNACTQDTCVGSVGCVNTLMPACPMPTVDAAADALDAAGNPDASDAGPADTAVVDVAGDIRDDVIASDTAKVDAIPDAKVDAVVDGSTGKPDATTTPDAVAGGDAASVDAAKDAAAPRPVAVAGGGGCDCNLSGSGGKRAAGTPLQAFVLVGFGLFWFARRRR